MLHLEDYSYTITNDSQEEVTESRVDADKRSIGFENTSNFALSVTTAVRFLINRS